MKRSKYLALMLLFSLFGGSIRLFAQTQMITKFAVVDTARVYQAYFRNSSPARNYDNKKEEFQAEVNRLTQELQQLHDQMLSSEAAGDNERALELQSEISRKTDYINEYAGAKNAELEALKNSLQNTDEFYPRLYATLERIAETGGYSMVLSLQQANAILWYSPAVDITNEVINQLGL